MADAATTQAAVDGEREARAFLKLMTKLVTLDQRVEREGDEGISQELRQELGEIKADCIVFGRQLTDRDTHPLWLGLKTAYLSVQRAMQREGCCNECETLFTPLAEDGGWDAQPSCPNCGSADIEPLLFFQHPIAL